MVCVCGMVCVCVCVCVHGVCMWCVYMVCVCVCVCTWCVYVVCVHGVCVCVCVYMVCVCGVCTWCVYMVCVCGVCTWWCVYVVCVHGVCMWCVYMVCVCGITGVCSNQRKANKKEAMELDDEIESRLSAAQTTLHIQVRGQGSDGCGVMVCMCRLAWSDRKRRPSWREGWCQRSLSCSV